MTRNSISCAVAILAGAGLTSLTGCRDKSGEAAPTPPTVEVVTVEQKDVPIYRDWVGTLEGEVNATISAQVTGYLVRRDYVEGSMVTNGQVLFQIERAPFEATLAQARAQLAEAEARKGKTALDVERYTPLAATEAISKQELDDAIQADKAAQGQVESAQAAVQTAEINLGFATIRSPVDGLAGLASAQAQVGNLVGPGTGALTTVVQINPIRVYFSISQELMIRAQERMMEKDVELRSDQAKEHGALLELVLAGGQLYPEKGRIRFANNQVDVRTGTVRVVGEFPNPKLLLVPGMFVNVRLLLETEKGALVVPQRVVTEMQGRYLIAIVGADNKIMIRPIQVGERSGSNWIISGEVKAGDKVVAEGIQKVRDGVVVNPVPFAEKTAQAAPASSEEKAEEKP